MKYIFIGAHPDDIEFSCGGTLFRLLEEGHEVHLVIMTNGGNTTNVTIKERMSEQGKAVKHLGIENIVLFGHKDGSIKANPDLIDEIGAILESVNPDFVITHYPDDSHQDHRNVSAIVKSATRRKYSLLYFDSYSSIGFKPNLFVDTTPYVARKVKLLECFESQIKKYTDRGIDFIDKSLLINRLNGYECKTKYAEGYVIDTYII